MFHQRASELIGDCLLHRLQLRREVTQERRLIGEPQSLDLLAPLPHFAGSLRRRSRCGFACRRGAESPGAPGPSCAASANISVPISTERIPPSRYSSAASATPGNCAWRDVRTGTRGHRGRWRGRPAARTIGTPLLRRCGCRGTRSRRCGSAGSPLRSASCTPTAMASRSRPARPPYVG